MLLISSAFAESNRYSRWLETFSNRRAFLEGTEDTTFKPVIGVLSQPVPLEKEGYFEHDQYLVKAYNDFIEAGNGQAVVIKYDLTDDELYQLLDQLNGVILTGGGILFFNTSNSTDHKYY
jgi:hypothetical protein